METIDLNSLTSTRPYMIRAMFAWLEDNNLTPYIMVDTTQPNVVVPTEFIQNNRIVLSIASRSTNKFQFDAEFINFHGRFSGQSHEIWVPYYAVIGIYAKEQNNLGMFFDPDEYAGRIPKTDDKTGENLATKNQEKTKRPRRENTMGLKVLK
ncbi:ClpXP protease specificity-enhancing factor [Moraxella macacae]|nr:ClpXP protease specificity-enhancing factor [Moraxella macacae]